MHKLLEYVYIDQIKVNITLYQPKKLHELCVIVEGHA